MSLNVLEAYIKSCNLKGIEPTREGLEDYKKKEELNKSLDAIYKITINNKVVYKKITTNK